MVLILKEIFLTHKKSYPRSSPVRQRRRRVYHSKSTRKDKPNTEILAYFAFTINQNSLPTSHSFSQLKETEVNLWLKNASVGLGKIQNELINNGVLKWAIVVRGENAEA